MSAFPRGPLLRGLDVPVIKHGSRQGPQGALRPDAGPASFSEEGRPSFPGPHRRLATCAGARSRCRIASEPASPAPSRPGRRG